MSYRLSLNSTAHGAAAATRHVFKNEGVGIQLLSHAARSSSRPVFHEGGAICGSVQLALKDGQLASVKAVTVELVGFQRKLFGPSWGASVGQDHIDEAHFVAVCHTIRDPAQPQASGAKDIPFQIDFPLTFTSKSKKARHEVMDLPPTFQATGYPTVLLYELRCKVAFKGLQNSLRLNVPITYIPRRAAGPPSLARALAYETGMALPSPTVDPAGWRSEVADIDLNVAGASDVRLHCVLSLPLPLEYARGTYIPFYVAMTCDNAGVLDLLSKPYALEAVLDRQVRISTSPSKRASDTQDQIPDVVGQGRYWQPSDRGFATRKFEGEIGVSRLLMQSFSYPSVSLNYTVQLRLAASLADLVAPTKRLLLKVPVDITYFPAGDCPRPISYAPPLSPGEKEWKYAGHTPPLRLIE